MDIKKDSLEFWKQGYAAGYLEGKATRDLIALHIRNTLSNHCDGIMKYCQTLRQFIRDNVKWMIQQIMQNKEDQYWNQIALTLFQFKGIQDAYYHRKPRLKFELDLDVLSDSEEYVIEPLMMLQLHGDLKDLRYKFKKPKVPHKLFNKNNGHCSALVKLLPDHSDLFFAHVTWMSYSTMLRMQKKYKFKTGNAGQTYAFSGYPGTISSIDDFIVTSARLAILETTITNHNETLNNYITPQTIPSWIRTQAAQRTASTVKEWIDIFAKHNSGTYNNQWVIVDYKKFKSGQRMQDSELIYVLEQLPLITEHRDMTGHLLNSTYWPNYNRAYFPKIQIAMDMPTTVKNKGDWFSHDGAPRGKIFARDHKNVVDMDSMIRLMRSNNFKEDPLCRCNCTPPYSSDNAISCRNDLNDKNGIYPFDDLGFDDQGGTDVKVTNSHLIKSLQFTAIAGPTHDPLPVFDWNNDPFDGNVPHFGQPSRWT
ncbi:hypothetical protein WR25_17721 [Diploscapter pachys]|uniref:Phospholipase B-like n=1 Tax=Diploscapter pachys TaxID=2018661 RepID=A0A2A2KRG4_9BILA|nr:hypothetical protein WR25_17721 [Diploscapter pachys]